MWEYYPCFVEASQASWFEQSFLYILFKESINIYNDGIWVNKKFVEPRLVNIGPH